MRAGTAAASGRADCWCGHGVGYRLAVRWPGQEQVAAHHPRRLCLSVVNVPARYAVMGREREVG
jgi:hypothetical protein